MKVNKKYITLSVLAMSTLFLAGCGGEPIITTDANTKRELVRIYALGDSITAGYQLPFQDSRPAQLGEMLIGKGHKKYSVINAGISGDTSKQLKDRLSAAVTDAEKGDIAIVTIGGNDGLRGLPIDELEANITTIIKYLQDKGITVVIGGMKTFQITSKTAVSYSKDFKNIYPRVAKSTKSILIPFILEGVALKGEYNLPDMIHPNREGYTIMATTVLDTLEKNQLLQ